MVEPYESRRQKKPTGAVKPMPAPFLGNAPPYGQSMPTMRPMDPGMGAVAMASAMRHPWQPNIAVPMSPETAKAIADREAMEARNENLRRGYEALRQKAPAFGTVAAGKSFSHPAVTELMSWEDWKDANIKERDLLAAGIVPEKPVPPWAGPTGRPRLPSTWELAKNKESTRGDGSKVAEAIRSRAAERKLKEEPRRAMVTAKAQGRRISPVQAGIEAALTAGRGLTEDQLRAMYGPVFDEIRGKTLASIAAAMGTAMSQGDAVPTPPNYRDIMNAFSPLIPGSGQTSVLPWMQGGQDNSPLGMVSGYLAMHPELSESFYKKLSDPNADEESLTRDLRLAGMPQEEIDRFLEAYTGKAKKPAVPYKDSIRQGLADMGKIGITTPGTPR